MAKPMLCPDEVESATGEFDPAGYDPNDCAGCGLRLSEHVEAVYCHPCSKAASADFPIYHAPPVCKDD